MTACDGVQQKDLYHCKAVLKQNTNLSGAKMDILNLGSNPSSKQGNRDFLKKKIFGKKIDFIH